MKTNVNPVGENEVELTVEVPAEMVKKAYDRTVAKARGEMQLPGFRKGRVPVNLVIQNLGEDYLRSEALEEAIPEWGDEALHESGLYDDTVGTSDLQVEPLDENADYSFSIKVQTRPTPVLGQYKGLEIPKREIEVTDAQVSAQLTLLQERLASLKPVEGRAVAKGDYVLMDFVGLHGGKLIEGAQGKDQMYEVGHGSLIPGFEEALIGVNHGEEKAFDLTFPDDYHAEHLAGQPATFKVTVKEIKEKVVPEIDDAFAADTSEFETLDELRADIRRRLEAAAEANAQHEFYIAAVTKAVENATMAVPSTMADREALRLCHDLEERVVQQGLTMDAYLEMLQKTPRELVDEMHPQAEFIIKRQLVLEAIAEAEKLEVTDDDITEMVKRDAGALGREYLELLGELEKSGRREALRAEMLVAKAADFVADEAVAVAMTEADEAAAEDAADAAEPAE